MQIQRSSHGLPATTILQISPHRLQRPIPETRGQETLLAAICHPPRISEVKPLADLLPGVLAAYGLGDVSPAHSLETFDALA